MMMMVMMISSRRSGGVHAMQSVVGGIVPMPRVLEEKKWHFLKKKKNEHTQKRVVQVKFIKTNRNNFF